MRGVELSRRSKEGEAAGLNTSSSEEKAAGNPLWQGGGPTDCEVFGIREVGEN